MLLEKKRLGVEDLEAQTALELPDREMMLVVVNIVNVLNGFDIDITVRNVAVALQICAIVEAINVDLLTVDALECDFHQTVGG